MKITYKNYTIEEDRSCYILTVHGVVEKGENKGQPSIKDQIYPSTVQGCIEKIIHYEKMSKTDEVTFREYLDEYKKITDDFLENIKFT